jgi:hypothetical protein
MYLEDLHLRPFLAKNLPDRGKGFDHHLMSRLGGHTISHHLHCLGPRSCNVHPCLRQLRTRLHQLMHNLLPGT